MKVVRAVLWKDGTRLPDEVKVPIRGTTERAAVIDALVAALESVGYEVTWSTEEEVGE